MPTDEPKGDATPGPFVGFQAYADDTPRDVEAEYAWNREPRSWDAPPAIDPAPPHDTYRDPPRAGVLPKVAVGAAVLAAFGAGILLARTDPAPATPPRPVSEAAAMAAAQPMNVEVAAVTPPAPAPVSSGAKLEVLPSSPGPVASLPFRPPPAVREPPTLALAPPAPAAPAPVPAAPAPREVAQAPVPRDAVAVAPPLPRSSFDCGDAPTRARAMVCRDPGLAAMDRSMKQAYAAAIAAGAPADELAVDQDDWLEVREEAASYSRRAVADLYRQRIDELDAMAGRR